MVCSEQSETLGLQNKHIFLGLILISMIAFFLHGVINHPIFKDAGYFQYFGELMTEGEVFYKDFFDHKTPLVGFFSAGTAWLGGQLGGYEIITTRIFSLLVSALVVGMTYLVTAEAFKNERLALLSAVVMMGWQQFIIFPMAGASPKGLMLLFFLSAMYAYFKKKRFLAGILSGLAFFSWQPGLLIGGLIVLAPFFFQEEGRLRKSLITGLGISVSPLLFGLYFYLNNALLPAYKQVLLFNIAYLSGGTETFLESIMHFLNVLGAGFRTEFHFVILGFIGWILGLIALFSLRFKKLINFLLTHRKITVFLGAFHLFALFTFLDFQGAQDFIPLLPFWAVFGGVAVIGAFKVLSKNKRVKELGKRSLFAFLVLILLLTGTVDAFYYSPDIILSEQKEIAANILETTNPSESPDTLIMGPSQMLCLLNQKNLIKYYFGLESAFDYSRKLGQKELTSAITSLKAEDLEFVIFARIREDYRKPLYDWADKNFEYRRPIKGAYNPGTIWSHEKIPRSTAY